MKDRLANCELRLRSLELLFKEQFGHFDAKLREDENRIEKLERVFIKLSLLHLTGRLDKE